MSVDMYWEELERPGPDMIEVAGVELRKGSRVRLRPRPGGDIFDIALAGKAAVIEAIEQDMEDQIHLAVIVEDDPGRDLGEMRQPGHRFFFSPAEVEPLATEERPPDGPKILVAGIGNVFMGDDGFGVEVAQKLATTTLPARVHVEDYGVRGMDLAYALADYDVAIFVDAVPRGDRPGTLYVIEPDLDGLEPDVNAHGMDPVQVLALATQLGELPGRVLVVGCEPHTRMTGEEADVVVALTEPVRAAVDGGVRLVTSLVEDIINEAGQPKETS